MNPLRPPQQGTDDLPLFNRALARTTDPGTSHAAAASVNVSEMESVVLDAIRALGDATSWEVSRHVGIERVTVSPRFKPLEVKGLIRRTGKTRPGESGRQSQVWECVR